MAVPEQLQAKNPGLTLYSVTSPDFEEYGRILGDMDMNGIGEAAQTVPMPESGSVYHASEPVFEALPIAANIRDRIFGTLDTQIGYCYGYNSELNATEWHDCSELNIALTPLVLILGRRRDIRDGKLDSALMKAFYLPAGTVVEIYATTLHFCPCQTAEEGFRCVVGLPEGTNLPLEKQTDDKLLFRRNKWLLAHEKNEALLAHGAQAGITGENLQVRY